MVALLNSPALSPVMAQSRRSGRHFHLHPWNRVPIPRYSETNELHLELAALCIEVEDEARNFLDEHGPDLPPSQIGRSNCIRRRLEETGLSARLDSAALRLMPNQCR